MGVAALSSWPAQPQESRPRPAKTFLAFAI